MTQLSESIRLLGDLLGETIVQQAGQPVFDLEEEIRGLAKGWRDGKKEDLATVAQIVNETAQDIPLTSHIVKAFSTYFQLVNLAEERERIRILRRRANEAFESGTMMDESIPAAVAVLKKEGFTADQVRKMLDQMLIMPVFTAHPTESRRRTIRQILGHISESLDELEDTLPVEHDLLREELAGYVTLLWQSDESRARKPTVMDEARNTGLYFFKNTLFDVVPDIYRELEKALAVTYPDTDWDVPAMLRFGSWIGGDRDGNPFVVNETTETAIRAQKHVALERYAADVQALYEMLSPALGRAEFNEDFLAQLGEEVTAAPESEQEVLKRFGQEPYRQKLILIYRRLLATIEHNQLPWDSPDSNARAFVSADELLVELKSIETSLLQNKGEILSRGRLANLIRRVQVFGFHLASIDIRQHSGRHEEALSEIFTKFHVGFDDSDGKEYSSMAEDDRVEILQREITNRRPLTAELVFSKPTNESVSLFRLVASAHENTGEHSVQNYIISMTESVSDVLEVLLLMSDANLFGKLDIVPLFETVDDLKNAPETMTRLFENPVYKQHLEQRGNGQQIMIGYSDSNKDGGFLRANWMLFTAQRNLAETCREHGIEMTLFHGRGGSIGRGGGPANRAILAQPPESIRGRIRITEQGEVVSSRYMHADIARRHLQQLLHAVICSSGDRPEFERLDRWGEIVDGLSQTAHAKYRQLVENDAFIHYFATASPIDQIDGLNLGSRPSKRRKTESLNDLRAIPWVFAWTQSRTNIPSWYGVGSAFNQWCNESGEKGLEELQQMYREWPFFKTLLQNVHVGMGRADMEISELYSRLAGDGGECHDLFDDIKNEFELARRHLLDVTGHTELLDTEPWLKHSIRVRNPYVDPLNYLQVALLQRYRESDDEQLRLEIRNVILQSVNGVAAGLQNVG